MTSKPKLDTPLVGIQIDRAKELCDQIPNSIQDFQNEIFYLDSNQLFKDGHVNQLLEIANHLDELNHLLTGLIKPKDIYYSSLRTALAAINSTPNALIITAHYINPLFKFNRILNRNTFGMELSLIVKKVEFTKQILDRVSSGRVSSRSIPRPVLNFRSR